MINQSYTPSTNGLQSYIEASPEYELSPIGIASMQGQAQKLAEFGRNGDIYVVHAAEGETVVPIEVLEANPQIKTLLFNQMAEMGLDPQRYVVGDQLNSLNPVTGMPEFFFKSVFRAVKKAVKKVVKIAKKIAPIALPIAASMFGVPFLGPMFGAGTIGASMLGSGIGSLVGGASLKDSLKAAAFGGLTSAGTSLLTGGIGGLQSAFTGKTAFAIPEHLGGGTGYKFAASPWASGPSGQASVAQWDAIKSGDLFQAAAPDWLGGGEYEGIPVFDEAGAKIGTEMGGKFSPLPSGVGKDALGNTTISTTPLVDPGPSEEFIQDSIAAAGRKGVAGTLAPVNVSSVKNPVFSALSGQQVTNPADYEELLSLGKLVDGQGNVISKAGGYLGSGAGPLGLPGTGNTLMDTALYGGGAYLGADAMGAFDVAEEEDPQETLGAAPLGLANQVSQPIDPDLVAESEIDITSPGVFDGVYTPPAPVLVPNYYGNVLQAAGGGMAEFPRRDLLVEGPGTERSDDIPAMLSDGEFVINSRAVRGADPSGRGNRYAGAQNLYNLMRNFEMRA